MISYKWFLSPLRMIPLAFGAQWLLWWLFLPDIGVMPTGEPKYYGLGSIVTFSMFFYLLILGVFLGAMPARSRPSRLEGSRIETQRFLYRFAVIAFWISLGSQFIRFFDFIVNPSALLIVLEPYGQNRLHAQVAESSPLGAASLGMLWIVAAVVFAQLRFGTDVVVASKRRVGFYLGATGALVLFYSVFEMTRVSFLTFIFIVLGAFFMVRRQAVRVITVCVIVTGIVVFVWAGSMLRTGLVMANRWGLPLISRDVQSYIWSELFEKYLGGELNNALIMMSYPTDITRNWAYATMFARFTESFGPPRYLNTLNTLGLWYWQFGVFGGMAVSLMIGLWLGRIYKRTQSGSCGLCWTSCYFLISYPGIFHMLRVNYFFLGPFLVPLFALFGAQIVWSFRRPLLRSMPAYHVSQGMPRESVGR